MGNTVGLGLKLEKLVSRLRNKKTKYTRSARYSNQGPIIYNLWSRFCVYCERKPLPVHSNTHNATLASTVCRINSELRRIIQ